MAQLPNNYYGWVSLGDMTAAAATAPNEWSTEMIIQGVCAFLMAKYLNKQLLLNARDSYVNDRSNDCALSNLIDFIKIQIR